MIDDFSMPQIITGNRIRLVARNNHDYDNDCWLEIDKNRSYLREYLLWVDKTNSLQDVASATDMFTDLWNKKENFAYSIVLNNTGKAIGSIDIHNIDYGNYSAEIGYWLAEEHNGNGYMSEAVKLIEKQAFDNGMNRIVIRTEAENVPSFRVAERNNYILEGIHRQEILKDGKYCDIKCYAKLKNS